MFIELGDLENVCIAFGISLLPTSSSEKRALPVWTAAILKSGLHVGRSTSGTLPVTWATPKSEVYASEFFLSPTYEIS